MTRIFDPGLNPNVFGIIQNHHELRSFIKVELSYKKEHTHEGETGNPAVKYLESDDPNFIGIAEQTALFVWIGKNQPITNFALNLIKMVIGRKFMNKVLLLLPSKDVNLTIATLKSIRKIL